MTYAEGVALVSQVIHDLREEVARDEDRAQAIWDEAAYRTAQLDSLEESLRALVGGMGPDMAWSVVPAKPCAPTKRPTRGTGDVPTQETGEGVAV